MGTWLAFFEGFGDLLADQARNNLIYLNGLFRMQIQTAGYGVAWVECCSGPYSMTRPLSNSKGAWTLRPSFVSFELVPCLFSWPVLFSKLRVPSRNGDM
jgi:hypothetical protein